MGGRPDYNVSAMNKTTGEKQSRVGAGWSNPDGSITVVLDPFVVVKGGSDVNMRLWPQEQSSTGRMRGTDHLEEVSRGDAKPGGGGEIPF